ncbi:hypothetical protein [Sedimenticola sp.]
MEAVPDLRLERANRAARDNPARPTAAPTNKAHPAPDAEATIALIGF